MSDLLEFKLRLQDLVSGGIQKLAATTHSAFGRIDKSVAATQKQFNMAGRSITDLNTRLSLLTQKRDMVIGTDSIKKANREVQELERQIERMQNMGRSGGSGRGGMSAWSMARGSFVGGLAVQGAMMAGREVIDSGKAGFSNGIELENMKVGLQTFVGNRANEIVEGVLKQAFYTPFTTASLLPIEMGFIATGMTPERSNKDMMNLANAVAATGGNDFILNRIGSDMMGAAAKGTIQGRELMELQRTGHINIEALVAKDLFPKMPMDKALSRVEDMDISFKEFESAIDRASQKGGMFAGALERLSQTIGGKNSTIKDMWWNMTAKLTESQAEPIKRIQDGIINALSDIPGILGRLQPIMSRAFDDFSYLMPHIKGFMKSFLDDFKPIGAVLFSDEMKHLAASAFDLSKTLLNDLKPAIILVAEAAKVAAGAAGIILKGASNDLDLKGAYHGAENFFTQIPTWQRNLSNQGGMSNIGKLHDYMMKNYGGHVQSWMNDPSQLRSWQAFGKLDPSLKPDFQPFNFMQRAGIGLNSMFSPSVALANMVKTGKNGMGAGAGGSGEPDAIIGGGTKVINIHFRNFTEHFTIHSENMEKGAHETFRMFEEWYLKLLRSVPG